MPEGRRQELKTEKTWVTKRMLPAIMVLLCLLLVSGVCFLAAKLIWEQGQDVAVSVDTSGKEYTERVTVTVSNVLGMDLLLDERDHSCAMLQFYGEAGWEDVCEIRFVREDPRELLRRLKEEEGKDIWICGGAEVIHSLLQDGWIDEYRISVIPTILGSGISLFGTLTEEHRLRLVNRQDGNGIVELTYVPR